MNQLELSPCPRTYREYLEQAPSLDDSLYAVTMHERRYGTWITVTPWGEYNDSVSFEPIPETDLDEQIDNDLELVVWNDAVWYR